MATENRLVPPQPGHAPLSFRSRVSQRTRIIIAALSAVALVIGIAGFVVNWGWPSIVVGVAGLLGLATLLPRSVPVRWSRPQR